VEWNWQGRTEILGGKTCPSATFSTTNPTWTDPGSKPGLRGGRLVAWAMVRPRTSICANRVTKDWQGDIRNIIEGKQMAWVRCGGHRPSGSSFPGLNVRRTKLLCAEVFTDH
jgi:hypothetical protein